MTTERSAREIAEELDRLIEAIRPDHLEVWVVGAREHLIRLRADNARLREAHSWRTIESAPSGVPILVFGSGSGSYEVVAIDPGSFFYPEPPTHWMPLPAPPAALSPEPAKEQPRCLVTGNPVGTDTRPVCDGKIVACSCAVCQEDSKAKR